MKGRNPMKMFRGANRFLALLGGLGLLVGGLITSCGSGESGGASQTGTIALLLTDGPAEEFSEVQVTVNEVSLLSDGQPPIIVSNEQPRVNLLALQEVDDLFMIHQKVPAGLYSKIRLRVSNPRFVTLDGNVIDGVQIDLVADGKIDLVARHPFEVSPGKILVIRLDLDANKSILIHPSQSGRFQFRPVVFVEILEGLPTRLVSVEGVIASEPMDQSFLLRRFHPIFQNPALVDKPIVDEENENRAHLIRVVVSNDTRFFDASGLPGTFESLKLDQHVHVRGLLSAEGGLHIEARLSEIGQFIRLHGSITSDINENRFGFSPDPGQGVTGDLLVQVYDRTLIFEAGTHRQLNPEDMVAEKRVIIEGVLDVGSEPDLLHAAVIVVKAPDLEVANFIGIIGDLGPANRTFNMTTPILPPCDPPNPCIELPQRMMLVYVVPDAVIIRIQHDENDPLGIELIHFDSLSKGDKVLVFGQFEACENPVGCPFHARVVIVEVS